MIIVLVVLAGDLLLNQLAHVFHLLGTKCTQSVFVFSLHPLHCGGSVKLASEVRPSDRLRQDVEEGEEHRSDPQGEADEPNSAEQQREQDDLEGKHDF